MLRANTMIMKSLSSSLVACNVYVSAGSAVSHRPLLLQLVKNCQKDCRGLLQSTITSSPTVINDNEEAVAVLVHAFSDPVYNRSSFHLAGTKSGVAKVASTLATSAIQDLRRIQENDESRDGRQNDDNGKKAHPFVGLVDHIAVMPLISNSNAGTRPQQTMAKSIRSDDEELSFVPDTASGWVARRIGHELDALDVDVYYYGTATPSHTPLATVRRERTQFFASGALSTTRSTATMNHHDSCNPSKTEVATVGAPIEFVENYNIRCTSACPKATAQSLTRLVRERDGGLPGVEALTLPYSNSRWEVACNLLKPHQSSSADVEKRARAWERDQQQQQQVDETQALPVKLIEKGYRVGTTHQQCLDVLELYVGGSEEVRSRHDSSVEEGLSSYLL